MKYRLSGGLPITKYAIAEVLVCFAFAGILIYMGIKNVHSQPVGAGMCFGVALSAALQAFAAPINLAGTKRHGDAMYQLGYIAGKSGCVPYIKEKAQ